MTNHEREFTARVLAICVLLGLSCIVGAVAAKCSAEKREQAHEVTR